MAHSKIMLSQQPPIPFTRWMMSPFTQELRIKKGGFEFTMAVEDGVAYGCTVKRASLSIADLDKSAASGGSLAFVNLEEERGLVLRHFRMELLKQVHEQVNDSSVEQIDANKLNNMILSGLAPSIMEYWDVDTDSTGNFLSGMPWRIKAYTGPPSSTRTSTSP